MVPLSFAPVVDSCSFAFNGQELRLIEGRALYWRREEALVVADLHLEKASWFAARGQMLPPYDSRATLERLVAALAQTGARRVFCLGDNFHDAGGPARLEAGAGELLAALARAADLVWITGNHDGEGSDAARAGIPGSFADALVISGVTLRHRAHASGSGPEMTGHFHPRHAVSARGRRIARPCAVLATGTSADRLILPAFGALTGGMAAADPAIIAALQPAHSITALVAAGARLLQYPLWRDCR